MKYAISAVLLLLIFGGIAIERLSGEDIYVENVEAMPEEPEYPEEWLQEAQEASDAVIQRKLLEAALNVVESDIEALRARQTALEKQLGTY